MKLTTRTARRPIFRIGACVCILAAAAVAVPAQNPAQSPPPSTQAQLLEGVVSLKLHGARDWTSTGLRVRAGDPVRIKAWGRVRLASAGNLLVDPLGADLPAVDRLTDEARAGQLIAVIGDDNNDYLAVGREADFNARREGTLYITLNQNDTSGNTGDFEIRVTVGNSRGLAFGRGDEALARAQGPPPTDLQPGPPAVASPDEDAKTVTVSARLDWTNTYLKVNRGDTVIVESSGTIVLDLAGKSCGPGGLATLKDPARLLLDKPTGAVVAVIGVDNNDFFHLGASGRFTAQRTGLLFLGVNEGDLTNNAGSFTSRVRIERAATTAPATKAR
ncbi:MAG: hypothetical protein IT175_16205 [Acidobacteria bacterium]|nr:hypothetical protein [Acidobacteriota bacterium]